MARSKIEILYHSYDAMIGTIAKTLSNSRLVRGLSHLLYEGFVDYHSQ